MKISQQKLIATTSLVVSLSAAAVTLAGCVVAAGPAPRHVAYYEPAPAVVVVHPRHYDYHERYDYYSHDHH